MREIDAAAFDCRAESPDLRERVDGWQAGDRAGNGSDFNFSGTRIISVADRGGQCGIRHEDEERAEGRAGGESSALPPAGAPFKVQQQLHSPALRWNAAARGSG